MDISEVNFIHIWAVVEDLQILVNAGAEFDTIDPDNGKTPLHFSAQAGIIHILL